MVSAAFLSAFSVKPHLRAFSVKPHLRAFSVKPQRWQRTVS